MYWYRIKLWLKKYIQKCTFSCVLKYSACCHKCQSKFEYIYIYIYTYIYIYIYNIYINFHIVLGEVTESYGEWDFPDFFGGPKDKVC